MRRIIFVLLLFVSGVSYGQGNSVKPRTKTISIGGGYYLVQDLTPISGYTRIFARYEWNSGAFDSTLYAPRYNGVPTGARVNENADIDGKIAVDTSNHRLYFYSGGSWRYSAAGSGGGGWNLSLNSITAGTDKIGTSNNARMNFYTNNVNTMTLDSLGARLYLLGGVDPLLSLKQSTTNQEWRLRVGVGTGILSSGFNLYDATASKIRLYVSASNGNIAIGNVSSIPSVSQLYVYGGATGGNIDARGDSTVADEANIEAEHSDYDGVSRTGYGLAMRVWGNVGVGTTAMGYLKKNMSLLDFTNETNLIRTLTNNSLRFGTNNTERMVLDSNGRLGINTVAPTSTLYVAGQSTVRPAIIAAHEDEVSDILILNKVADHRFSFHSTGYIKMNDISAPSTPASGYGVTYIRSDSLRFKNDAGTEFTMGTGGGGVTTLAAIGSSANANGATISGSTLNLEPASASFGGVVTTGTQTLAGAKTFTSDITLTQSSNSNISVISTSGSATAWITYKAQGGNWYSWAHDGGSNQFRLYNAALSTYANWDYTTGNLALGQSTTSATAKLMLGAGTASASTAPLKFTTGTSLTTAEAGAMEYTTPQLFFTNGGGQRQEIPQIQQARVSTQYDNTTTTLGTVTGLTTNVAAGKTYRFEAVLYTTSSVAGGVKFAMAGTATATNIIYEAVVIDANVNSAQTRATALATTVGAVTAVTNAYCKITGTITVNAAGTFLVQAAANAATGTTSVLVGSTFVITEML